MIEKVSDIVCELKQKSEIQLFFLEMFCNENRSSLQFATLYHTIFTKSNSSKKNLDKKN